jgi:hypothetical protein
MARLFAALSLLVLSSCYIEWDIPKVPRRDLCTGVTENGYVYVQPTCPNPPPRNPRDYGDNESDHSKGMR